MLATPRITRASDGRAAAPRWWTWLAAVEVALAVAAVVLDVLIPSLVLVLLAVVSLGVRHQGPGTLGLRRSRSPGLVPKMFGIAAGWSLVQLGLTMPVANHLSGHRQDLSQFADVHGDLVLLSVYLLLSWTLAAFVEELAFRGFLLSRIREVLGSSRASLVTAVLLTSVLFGVLHSEQGVIGVVLVSLDAIVLAVVRIHFDTLWAAVLVHGFDNTLGFVTFFLVGPVYGLW
ncbi:CPBP family intramembrane glutamic endopeptidase [Nocardioides cynanchi]|uniref:CPBP family intramembrane glutamic endopeptidase n=1 Tax=Nocardioides cynanchi TaxID=2558918 RepID=UPI001244F74B|nr:CPBP family intramembrane glutamic endopeptidase [Nocardioides cynanchi]